MKTFRYLKYIYRLAHRRFYFNRFQMEEAWRQQAKAVYVGNGTILCRVMGKFKLFADAQDMSLTPHFCLDGFWESWITLAMARMIKPGWHCVDAGANHGYFTLLMADRVGPTGRVLAIEPNPRLADLLNRNILANGFDAMTLTDSHALLDKDGKKVCLAVPPTMSGGASIYRDPQPKDEVIEVESRSLDSLVRHWPRVDLVKIDAEGAEEAIFSGMRETIAKNGNLRIVMEFAAIRYKDPKGFLARIQEQQFSLAHIDYDARIRPLRIEECISKYDKEHGMLLLARGMG